MSQRKIEIEVPEDFFKKFNIDRNTPYEKAFLFPNSFNYLFVDKTNIMQMSKTEMILKINSIDQKLNLATQDFIYYFTTCCILKTQQNLIEQKINFVKENLNKNSLMKDIISNKGSIDAEYELNKLGHSPEITETNFKSNPDYIFADILSMENAELKIKLDESYKNNNLLKSYINSKDLQNSELMKNIAKYEENKKILENKIYGHIENEKIYIRKIHEMKIEIRKNESLLHEQIQGKDKLLSQLNEEVKELRNINGSLGKTTEYLKKQASSSSILIPNSMSKHIQTESNDTFLTRSNSQVFKITRNDFRKDISTPKNSELSKINCNSINKVPQTPIVVHKSFEFDLNELKSKLNKKDEECIQNKKKIIELEKSIRNIECKLIDICKENIELKRKRENAMNEILSIQKKTINIANNSTGIFNCYNQDMQLFDWNKKLIVKLENFYKDLLNIIPHMNSKEGIKLFIQLENKINVILSNLKEFNDDHTESQKNNEKVCMRSLSEPKQSNPGYVFSKIKLQKIEESDDKKNRPKLIRINSTKSGFTSFKNITCKLYKKF